MQENLRAELRAETLITSLLREKLYSKEQEIEQLQAEVAAAVRGNEILRCEVQNTLDNLSVKTHDVKDLKLQVNNINHPIRVFLWLLVVYSCVFNFTFDRFF